MTHNETKEKEKERKFGVYRALSKQRWKQVHWYKRNLCYK